MKTYYRTIVLSDIHLGTNSSKAKEVTRFLKHHKCDTLILNGDIIDGWQLKKSGKWQKRHTNFFKHIINLTAKNKCDVIYLRGNHDDFLEEMIPFTFGRFQIKKYHIHYGLEKKYFVTHGDIFDNVTSKFKWIAKLGDIGYTFLLWFNHHYNNYREKKGLPYYSVSQAVKAKVKSAVSFISDYENELVKVARARKCDGIICGHIHQPVVKDIHGIEYLNSGDWVENLSALVEDENGKWHIVYYHHWQMIHEAAKKAKANKDIDNILPPGVTLQG
ncbi:MAG: UDP-2,3-diacylglucosamine diphosphatase [Bacteroidetes bacterium]|nr:UDP-2,3-diacylglucosamine diphosphatase [Bacteroidota bacterium]